MRLSIRTRLLKTQWALALALLAPLGASAETTLSGRPLDFDEVTLVSVRCLGLPTGSGAHALYTYDWPFRREPTFFGLIQGDWYAQDVNLYLRGKTLPQPRSESARIERLSDGRVRIQAQFPQVRLDVAQAAAVPITLSRAQSYSGSLVVLGETIPVQCEGVVFDPEQGGR